jgi:site-specific recombinase XerD
MRAIRCFYSFLAREEIIETNPMARVEIPKVPMRYPEVLSESQMKALLKACPRRTITGIRNYAIVLTFIDTGIRLSELINLDLEDVDLRSRTIRIRNGKGGKERQVFVGRKLFHALRKWLDVRGFSLPSNALFVSSTSGDRLDKRNVARILERLGKKAGVPRVHPHLLRHSFATHYIMNGGDPFTLQRLLGHSSIKTTMIYVNMAGASLRENHAKASPGDRL